MGFDTLLQVGVQNWTLENQREARVRVRSWSQPACRPQGLWDSSSGPVPAFSLVEVRTFASGLLHVVSRRRDPGPEFKKILETTKEEEEFFQSAAGNAKETHHFSLNPSRNVSRGPRYRRIATDSKFVTPHLLVPPQQGGPALL